MSESILELDSGPRRPSPLPRARRAAFLQRHPGGGRGSRAQRLQRDLGGVTAKGQEEKTPPSPAPALAPAF